MLHSFDMLVLQQLEKKKKGRREKERTKGSTDIYRLGIAERVWNDSHYTTELKGMTNGGAVTLMSPNHYLT